MAVIYTCFCFNIFFLSSLGYWELFSYTSLSTRKNNAPVKFYYSNWNFLQIWNFILYNIQNQTLRSFNSVRLVVFFVYPFRSDPLVLLIGNSVSMWTCIHIQRKPLCLWLETAYKVLTGLHMYVVRMKAKAWNSFERKAIRLSLFRIDNSLNQFRAQREVAEIVLNNDVKHTVGTCRKTTVIVKNRIKDFACD